MSDTTKDGEPGHGEEPTEDGGKEYVEDSYGGQDAEMSTEEDIITTDTTTGPELGDINMFIPENWYKIIFSLNLLMFKEIIS